MVKKLLDRSKNLFSRQHTNILSAATIIAASYALSGLFGLIRNRLLAARFFGGFESDLDVYFAAFVLPDTLFQLLVVGALSAAFIPVYSRYLKKNQDESNDLVNATLNSILLLLTVATVIIAIFARQISGLIASFPPDQATLMANLMRLMLISQLFFTVSTFLTGIIQSHQRFLIPAIAPLLYNVGIILGIIILSPMIGIYSAAIGVIIGAILHMLIQIPFAFNLGYRYRFYLKPQHPGVISIRRLMLPRTAALAVSQAERWIAVTIASFLSAGSLSLFNFARQLYIMPITLFGVSLGQASFPQLSSLAYGRLRKFSKTLSHSILQIFFFSLPASALLLILRIPIVRLVFGADSFPWSATLLTGKTVAIFAISVAPQASTHVLVRAFYALENTKTPLIISFFTVLISLALSYFFALNLDLGIVGLSLALTITNIINFIWLVVALQRHTGRLKIYSNLFKMIVCTFFTVASLWLPLRLLDQFVFDTTRTLPLIALTSITGIIGLLVYFIFSYLLNVPQLETVFKLLKRLGNWRKLLSQSEEVLEPPTLSTE